MVPARNEAEYIDATLAAIRSQSTDEPIEVIVADGGSDDGTRSIARERGLDAASSRCRIPGVRATCMELVINHVFPRLPRPILPGFNFLVRRETVEATGGFPAVPNEDTAYSRRLARTHRTGYCREVLVETSPRRIDSQGLTGTAIHYLVLDWRRLRSS